MATPLDKDLVRESTFKHSEREILVTLTADQKVSFKLKGLKSGTVSISIDEIYRQLIGEDPAADNAFDAHLKSGAVEIITEDETAKTSKANASWMDKASKDNPMISLHSMRSDINTTPMPLDTKVQLEGFMIAAIEKASRPYKEAEARAKAESLKRR